MVLDTEILLAPLRDKHPQLELSRYCVSFRSADPHEAAYCLYGGDTDLLDEAMEDFRESSSWSNADLISRGQLLAVFEYDQGAQGAGR